MLVGSFTKESKSYVFTYDDKYLRARNIIPLGPEFPLTQRQFRSSTLFPSLEDRIPSKQNSAYTEYCHYMGIDPSEENPLILLSTIGKRGPSSFVFEPSFERTFTVEELVEFRERLKLTTREFAQIFEIPQSSLNAIECKRKSGKDLLKKLEIIVRFPAVALFFLFLNGGVLAFDKRQEAVRVLKGLGTESDPLS